MAPRDGAAMLLLATVAVVSFGAVCEAVAVVAADVQNAQQLQDAVNLKQPYIHISQHINLTGLNAGTPYENTLIFPDNPGDIAMWGQCDGTTLPDSVKAYNVLHASNILIDETSSCSIYTQSRSLNGSVTLPGVAAFKLPNGGRLFLSNVIVSTAAPTASSTGVAMPASGPKAAYGISIANNAELWLVFSVVAFFEQARILSVDSHVFSIWSLTYQVGPMPSTPEVAVAFLQQNDQVTGEQPLTLFSYTSTFHYDNLPNLAPIYVGPLVLNENGSVAFGTPLSSLKTSPRVILDSTFKHVHINSASGCVGVCVCAPGISQPLTWINATNDPAHNFYALSPMADSACSSNPAPVAQPITAITWADIVPPGHDAWATALVQANIPNSQYALNPYFGQSAVNATASGSSGLSSGAIVGIAVGGAAGVALLIAALVVLICCCRRRNAHRRQEAAADYEFGAPPSADKHPAAGVPPNYSAASNHAALLQANHSGFGTQSEGYAGSGYAGSYAGSHAGSGYNHTAGSAGDVDRERYRQVSGVGPLEAPSYVPPGGFPGQPQYYHQLSVQSGDGAGRSRSSQQGTATLAGFTQSRSIESQNASTQSGANGSPHLTSFESVTRKRENYGITVKTDFSFIDSLLDEVERTWNGELFGRYYSLGRAKRSYGGQGMVQFAMLKFNTDKQLAIKFFMSHTAFCNEQALYSNPNLHRILPPIDDAGSNEDGRYVDPLGRAFPPYVVMEKGQPLDEFWKRSKPDFPSCVQIIHHLCRRIAELHSCGLCHRDLKPTNTIWLPSRNEWTLIDFGSAATIGSPAELSLSLGYAAPESIQAWLDGTRQVVASPAVDVWALGVMSIELLTGKATYPRDTGNQLDELVVSAISGGQPLHWEVPENLPQLRRKMGFMAEMLLRMVRRQPEERPTLKDVDMAWRQILQEGTSTLV